MIGAAFEQSGPDGGPSSSEIDHTLATWAEEIAGPWEGPPGTNVKITFTASDEVPRSGTAVVEAYSELFCILITCEVDPDTGWPKPPKAIRNLEYWLLKLEEGGALVSLLDADEQVPVALNCVYIRAAPARFECGPEDRRFVLQRPPR